MAVITATQLEHRFCGRLHLSYAAAHGLCACRVRSPQTQPRAVLSGDFGGNDRQHAGRHGELVDGLAHTTCDEQIAELQHPHPRSNFALKNWDRRLVSQLAARRRGSAVRTGRLAQNPTVAVHAPYSDWQVLTLRDHDRLACVVLARSIWMLLPAIH